MTGCRLFTNPADPHNKSNQSTKSHEILVSFSGIVDVRSRSRRDPHRSTAQHCTAQFEQRLHSALNRSISVLTFFATRSLLSVSRCRLHIQRGGFTMSHSCPFVTPDSLRNTNMRTVAWVPGYQHLYCSGQRNHYPISTYVCMSRQQDTRRGIDGILLRTSQGIWI